MRIRMRMGDVDGDASYLYVCRYVYVCICAYLMQCVMLSRLYGFVGRQYCTYLYKRERRERRKYHHHYQQHKEHTLVGVFTIIWEIHYLSGSAPSLPTLSHANPPENSQRERKRGDLYPLSNCTASPSTLALCGYR